MPSLNWTPQALADIQRLYRFLAPQDLNAARNAITELRSSVKILTYQPALGRRLEELPPHSGNGLSASVTAATSFSTASMTMQSPSLRCDTNGKRAGHRRAYRRNKPESFSRMTICITSTAIFTITITSMPINSLIVSFLFCSILPLHHLPETETTDCT